jgi:2-dehydro-3-deoxygalactonokinase
MQIYVEWTSAAFAADLIDEAGKVAAEIRQPSGVNEVSDGAFERRFLELIPGDWRHRAKVAYLSGMITGRGGWLETGFAPVPAGLAELAAQGKRLMVDGLPVVFLCGISADGLLPDVMRGEEVKALAAAGEHPVATVILPGAHTKYVGVEDQRITRLATYMGGETAALLRRDSLISRLIPKDAAITDTGFEQGLTTAWRDEIAGGLLRRLFSARSLVLFERLPREDIAGYIAGLVTGAEILEAETEWALRSRPVLVAGGGPEAVRYLNALNRRGIAVHAASIDIGSTIAGLAATAPLQG